MVSRPFCRVIEPCPRLRLSQSPANASIVRRLMRSPRWFWPRILTLVALITSVAVLILWVWSSPRCRPVLAGGLLHGASFGVRRSRGPATPPKSPASKPVRAGLPRPDHGGQQADTRSALRAILPADPVRVRRPHWGLAGDEGDLVSQRAKSRTRGRKLHLAGTKARVARTRQTRRSRTAAQSIRRGDRPRAGALVEAMKQQTATSRCWRIISNSSTEIQPVLDAGSENAARLCDANNAVIFRLEGNLLRL